MSSGEPLGMVITTSGVVGQVRDEGQAAKAGMAPGCKIIMVGDQNVSNLEEIKAAVQAIRARGERFYTLKYKVQLLRSDHHAFSCASFSCASFSRNYVRRKNRPIYACLVLPGS